MVIGITGSRNWQDKATLRRTLTNLAPSKIITGGCTGTDRMAEEWARENNVPVSVYLPEHQKNKHVKYHPRYFHMRNRQIVNDCDLLLAFPMPGSKGTISTIRFAEKIGKPVKIIG